MHWLAGTTGQPKERLAVHTDPAILQRFYLSRHPSPRYFIQRWSLMFGEKAV